jgi:hypothetical protein
MNVYPGARYRLTRPLTGINHDDQARSRMVTLPPETLLTVAGVVQGFMFIQITCGTATYDVAAEDLQEAAKSLQTE